VEGSRERLGVEAIDFYQIHWPVPEEEIEEGWSTLAELKERGWCALNRSIRSWRRRTSHWTSTTSPRSFGGRDLRRELSPLAADALREELPFGGREGIEAPGRLANQSRFAVNGPDSP
jgi:hypothetical protein